MNPEPIRILLVDDDEDDYLIIKGLLHEALHPAPQLEWIANTDAAQEAIAAARHDIYLVDYRLGEHSGLELLEQFNMGQRQEPFIILTGAGDESIEEKAKEMGASDYLVKGTFGAGLLGRIIGYSLQRKHMEAQRMQHLMDLNRSKDEFIALTSHQLRTPVTAVKQFIGILMAGYAGDVTPEQYTYLQKAYNSNERQLKIINDILRIAQLDTQAIKLQMIRYDILALLEDCLAEVNATFAERSQTVHFDTPKRSLYVECDPAYLTMALGNILDNASKYTPHGKHIWVTVKSVAQDVRISIRDEGVGIAKADFEKLFKRFSRIDNPLSVQVGGTGLGLYWAHEVIELLHGNVEVDSIVDKGTAFIVVLPKIK